MKKHVDVAARLWEYCDMQTENKAVKITLEIIRDFEGMGRHCFRVTKITGAICAHTLNTWDGKGEDGPDVNVGDRIIKEQADDLSGQERYEITVVPGKQ